MKFTLKDEDRNIKTISRVLDAVSNDSFPIRVEASDDGNQGSITLSAFDGTKYIALSVSAEVETEGSVTFPVECLSFLKHAEGDVIFAKHKRDLSIKDSVDTLNVALIDESGPVKPGKKEIGSVTLGLDDVKKLVRRAVFASGKESDLDDRFNYGCILLECSSDQISAIGSDRRVIAVARNPKGSPFNGRFLLPKAGVNVINKLEGEMITVLFYKGAVGFSVYGEMMCDVYIPEYSGTFPPYERHLEISPNTTLTGTQEELSNMLSKMKKISEKVTIVMAHTNYVKQKARVSARSEVAKMQRHTDMAWEGEDLRIHVNARTLLNAVNLAEGTVTIGFTNDRGPYFVRGESNDYLSILMPYLPVERR